MATDRTAKVTWAGSLMEGAGRIEGVDSGAFGPLDVTWASRAEEPEGRTSPEELLAAAHGGCFTMSLAGELTGAGTPPGRLDVHCRITMDEVEGRGHLIVHSALEVHASVPELSEDAFAAAVEAAHSGCSFSTLLRDAGVSIDIQTTLES